MRYQISLSTGETRIGKSTILSSILERLDVSIGGYIVERNTKDYRKTFTVKSLYDGVGKHIIANVNIKDKSKEVYQIVIIPMKIKKIILRETFYIKCLIGLLRKEKSLVLH